MTHRLPPFTKLPTRWIEQGGLTEFRWNYRGSDHLAALMLLIAIAHHIDLETGVARLSYSTLCDVTGLSRAKVSDGLTILERRKIIARAPSGRGTYELVGYDPKLGYAQLPARGLYHQGVIDGFKEFRLRRPVELDALKLYLTFAARRDRNTNFAHMTYEQIEAYCGVPRNRIRSALSVLAANGLVHVEHFASRATAHGVAQAYRLRHLESYRHMGTSGRGGDFDIEEVRLGGPI